jgi:N-acyl homoserine lactone hydrolase
VRSQELHGSTADRAYRTQRNGGLRRFKKIAENLKATVILQHDGRDIGRLPAFPAAK